MFIFVIIKHQNINPLMFALVNVSERNAKLI